ncbi:MAG: aminoacyl-tRNA deacylase [Anaerolineae bacterium]|jgi:Cys-tRNA(Pro)/Cys-tRNA(Cys) deacylase
MSGKNERTNAMRLLDARKVPYEVHRFSDEIHSAEGVADALGLPAGQVFKTLVALPVTPKGRPLLAIVPGHLELNLKQLARAAGEKKVRMATQKEAETLTGLQVGGISALALLNKGFRIYLDQSADRFARILVSAGQRGINLELAPADLIRVTGARTAPLAGADED